MKVTLKIFFVFLFLSLLVLRPTPSYAWHGGGYGHGWGHGYVGVSLGWPGPYYYGYGYPYYPYYADPYYYPAYATVPASTYQPVIVNGVTYYVNNGAYYVYTQYGYQAVTAPANVTASVVQTAPVVQAAPVVTTVMATSPETANNIGEDSYTINIPNDKGSYTAVLLKRTDKGFIGPQGELYPDFPKVSQLKLMYGK